MGVGDGVEVGVGVVVGVEVGDGVDVGEGVGVNGAVPLMFIVAISPFTEVYCVPLDMLVLDPFPEYVNDLPSVNWNITLPDQFVFNVILFSTGFLNVTVPCSICNKL